MQTKGCTGGKMDSTTASSRSTMPAAPMARNTTSIDASFKLIKKDQDD